YLTINRLKGIIEENDIEMTVTTFFKIVKKITTGISVPFEGEPLSGLQIMGVLETRALDFENIIILSMNEGVFPVKKVASSIIPYNLRKGFELSTTEHQDSIYAYYFYRLISRAKRVFLLYDTRTENMASGEVSRYVYQLKYHYRFDLKEEVSNYSVAAKGKYEIAVQKDEYVLQQLARYLEGGDRSLSASAINTYITCPLQFYLGYVEDFRKGDEVSEDVDAAVLGSIYHGIMQRIYDRMEDKKIWPDELKAIEHDDALLTTYIEEAFAKNYFKTPQKIHSLSGKNYLTGEVIRKYVKRTLEFDRYYAPFIYLESERKITCLHPIDENRKVSLKGFIDRMDKKDMQMRIVDYKTGNDDLKFDTVEELFDKRMMNRRPKAVMQVLLYAMMVAETDKPDIPIKPAIYRIQKLYSDEKWETCIKMKGLAMDNFRKIEEPFRLAFNWCLHEIFNPDIPFFQQIDTGNWSHCSYCTFASICQQMTK
ncbi:MAG: PD-(D/E)XK nuclease family protein, partial [Porphyromonadaceae bacterium]|nr:PD-(D/E)XK nuclease family protein [Porphyromonadaceae bacterium]